MRNRRIETPSLPIVREVRAADLSPAEREALKRIGWREPLSARIGRGPLATFAGAVKS